eukprot:scaffold77750_cov21-Tisochrysis_lutea.AAC.1
MPTLKRLCGLGYTVRTHLLVILRCFSIVSITTCTAHIATKLLQLTTIIIATGFAAAAGHPPHSQHRGSLPLLLLPCPHDDRQHQH